MACLIFVFCGALFFCILLILFINWIFERSNSAPKIKFKDFKKFYLINPDRWKMYSATVGCLDESKYSYTFGHKYIELNFSCLDYFKYIIWKFLLEHRKKNIKSTETMLRVVELVKKDIAKSEELAQKRQNEALDNIDKILNGGKL